MISSFRQEILAGAELLDAIVPSIRHIDVARGIHRNNSGVGELSVSRTGCPPFQEEAWRIFRRRGHGKQEQGYEDEKNRQHNKSWQSGFPKTIAFHRVLLSVVRG